MNINDIANTLAASLTSSTGGNSARRADRSDPSQDPIQQALNQASQRLEDKKQQTDVKLSSLGQVKSSISELQNRSESLTKLNEANENTETTPEDKQKQTRAAAESFVGAFNNARQTLQSAINGENRSGGALADENRARIAANELSRSISSGTQNDLKAIGISVQSNGSLKFDAEKFKQAQQANPEQVTQTLSDAGRQVEQSANRQLSNNGNISRSINTLSREAEALDNAQQAQRMLAETMQRNTENATDRLNATNAAGIAAYQKIFNL